MSLTGRNITLIVTGSIAAYKSADIVRQFKKSGARVHVILSAGAQEFITPLTLQTLSGNTVATKIFDLTQEAEIGHIHLADSADLVLVAPASANILAKAAHGLADDLASTVLLAAKCAIAFAPAMNVNMWENAITQKNVQTLKDHGCHFIEPDSGELACGWVGPGRLAETEVIVESARVFLSSKDLTESHVVITAGPTRENFDSVRFLSNRSSGKMGYALARAARRLGAEVTLITGPTSLNDPHGVDVRHVQSAEEMRSTLFETLKQKHAGKIKKAYVAMVAAVADFRPEKSLGHKASKEEMAKAAPKLVANPDILKELGEVRSKLEKESQIPLRLIGFAAQTGTPQEARDLARAKLKAKNVDLIVANLIEESFEKDTNRVWVIDREGKEVEFGLATKDEIAEKILLRASRI